MMVSFEDWLERSHGRGRKCPALYKPPVPGFKELRDKDTVSFMANVTVKESCHWRSRCQCER